MVVKLLIEPELESHFHPDSYGYRPGKSAHDALKLTLERSRKRAWVLDMDIKGFFDNLDHRLLMRAVNRHVTQKWARLYIYRWLTAPVQHPDGSLEARVKGTPQGGVISPLLANLYLHYTFDKWMERHYSHITFERYADDVVCHCAHQLECEALKAALTARFEACGLQLHPEKTKIVYCKSHYRRGRYPVNSFDFLGYRFQPRLVRNRHGKHEVYFMAGISPKASTHIRQQIRRLPWLKWQGLEVKAISDFCRSRLTGWLNYFKLFGESEIRNVLFYFDKRLRRWAHRKYKALKTVSQAAGYVNRLRLEAKSLFAHWRCNKPNKGWVAGAV